MLPSSNTGKSVDNLGPLSPPSRPEFPFNRSSSRSGLPRRPASRRGSTASSVHSVGGALDTASGNWKSAVHEAGQNAISTLLQPSIVRTGLSSHASSSSSGHKPPTARDIPPVTLTNIPRIDPDEFSGYLSQVGALYQQLQRVKENEEDEFAARQGSKQDDQPDIGGNGLLKPAAKAGIVRKGSSASLSSLNSIEAPALRRRSSAGLGRKSTQGPPPLSTIPTVYFDEDFHLENPRTFDVVSERSEVIPPNQHSKDDSNGTPMRPRKALATNAILQEKLSWYMDTVEVHLINSISTASTTFFTALGSLKELHAEAADSVQRIQDLRSELAALDEEVASAGLKKVQKRQRQNNLQQLNDAVTQLKRVVEGVAACENLVDAGEVDQALASIDSVEKLIAGERDQITAVQPGLELRDLRSASALQGVNADLGTLRLRAGKVYEAQFYQLLLSDLKRHTESVPSADVLLRWHLAAARGKGGHARSPSAFPAYLGQTDELKAQLFPSMLGLQRARHVAEAAAGYREAVLREIRSLIRRPLPSSSDDDNESVMSSSTAGGGRNRSTQEKSTTLARNLRALEPEDAEALLVRIYVGVTETLRRFTIQVKVLLDIASSLSASPNGDGFKSPPVRSPMTSPRPERQANPPGYFELQEELHKALDMSNLLGEGIDIANDKIVKILRVRTEQATHLPLDMFLRYFTLNLYFATECEAISGRSGTSLTTVVNGHIRDFVQKNRDAEMQKLASGMEGDQWNAEDFNEGNLELLNQILEYSTQDATAWRERTKIWVPYEEVRKDDDASSSVVPGSNGARAKTRTATIDSETFTLPKSAILCLEGTVHFLQLISGIPSMTNDIAASLVAYLQLFNSRCTQLILGTGAIKSAGLKTITAKHLSLASQALSFITALIPHMREFIRRHAGTGTSVSNLMGDFDRAKRQLQEHQDSIHQKLIDIMNGRAKLHAKTVASTDWDATSGPHAYMDTLTKDLVKFYRVLTKHLPDPTIQMIMVPVSAGYREQIGQAFMQAAPRGQAGQDSMLRDAELFVSTLGKIDGLAEVGEHLASIVKAKHVEVERPPPPPSPPAEAAAAVPDEPAAETSVSPDPDPGSATNTEAKTES